MIPSSFFQGMFSPEKGTFQQYATVPADLAAEVGLQQAFTLDYTY